MPGLARIFVCAALVAACQQQAPAIAGMKGDRRTVAETSAPACVPQGAHAAHTGSFFECAICHPCGGALGIGSVTLSDGFAVSGSATKDQTGVSCTVTCHGSQPVSWTGGSLGCANCHGQWQAGAQTVSAHGIDPAQGIAGNSAVCTRCHNTANHFDPSMAIVNAQDGSAVLTSAATPADVSAFCVSCHFGSGKTLAGQAPPVLPGWTSATGDFHGARAGTGFSGTLAAPFARGQAALDCGNCHDFHASSNAFLFAATVNGNAVPSASITRAGFGAEALCSSCHLGDMHAGCKASGCHDDATTITRLDGTVGPIRSSLAAASNKPCFWCHGHEGISNFVYPSWDNHPSGTGNYCSHCHSDWYPAITSAAPVVRNLAVSGITTSAATITWDTSVPTTTFVEYGATDVTAVAGSATLTTQHSWTLANLATGTTYKYRVRVEDALRNLTETPATPATFSTASPGPTGIEPAPTGLHAYNDPIFLDLVAVDATVTSNAVVTFRWAAVASPVGTTRYRLQVSLSPTFATTLIGPLEVTTTSTTATISNLLDYPGQTYYWRVLAIDNSTGAQSAWATASFQGYSYWPYG